jgi:hypothetical protein
MTFEIETVIVPNHENIRELAEKEHTEGLVSIGTQSVYGRVYSNNEINYAVKIGSGGDMGYRSYVKIVAHFHEDCKYLPKISRAILYRHEDSYYEGRNRKPGEDSDDVFVVYMEKLKHPRTPGYGTGGAPINRFTYKLSEMLRTHIWSGTLDWSKLRPVHRDLLTILLLAREHREGNGFDIHFQNVMARGKQFVITDPLTGY